MQLAPLIADCNFMRIRHKFFIAIALITGIPLLLLLFVVIERAESEIKTSLESELHGTLNKMSGELELLLNDQRSIARGLSRVPAIKQFAVVAKQNNDLTYRQTAEGMEQFFLNYQHAVPSIQALRFIDTQGRTLVKIKEGKAIPAKKIDGNDKRMFIADQSNRSFFQQAWKSSNDVTMSDFELGQVSVDADFCPAMVRYTVKLKDEVDAIDGFLVVNMWGTQVDSTVKASIGGYSGNPYIVELNDKDPDRDGIYLYHHDNTVRFANQLKTDHRFSKTLSDQEWAYLKSEVSGSIYQDSGRMLFFEKFMPDSQKHTQWALIIETDSDTVLAPINKLRWSIWFMLAFVLFVGLLIARWSATKLTNPVNELARIIKRYADGDEKVRYQGLGKDEIGTAGRAFNYLTENLEQAERERDKAERAVRQSERLAAVGQMAAGIGHEINNPLMNIMSLAALLKKELKEKDEQMHNDITLLMKEGRRCARIVQGILNFARESTPTYQSINMKNLVEDTIELLQHRIDSENLAIEVEADPDVDIVGDPNLLQQVFVNVLLNAIQASPAGSTIALRLTDNGERVCVDVLDSGPGINDINLSQVLDPFFTTKPEGGGTGLGLSVSYGIVKDHGGDIRLENRSEGGVRVLICLPREANQLEQEENKPLEAVNAN